jgi:hypothetical protein
MLQLQRHLHRIDDLIAHNQAQKRSDITEKGSSWVKDNHTTLCCSKLFELSSAISQSCLKCAIISGTATTAAMESISHEIANNYEELMGTFWLAV